MLKVGWRDCVVGQVGPEQIDALGGSGAARGYPLNFRFAASGNPPKPFWKLIIRPSAYTQTRLLRVITASSSTPVVGLLGTGPRAVAQRTPPQHRRVLRVPPGAPRRDSTAAAVAARWGTLHGRSGVPRHDAAIVASTTATTRRSSFCDGGRGASPP